MIITESRLKILAAASDINLIKRRTQKSLSFEDSTFREQKTIFLSHKHDEDDFVDEARRVFGRYKLKLYIDWLDDNMPKITNAETAIKLKKTIQESDKFIFLATEGAIHSSWCNWELGFGDTYKYPKHIALLPVKKDNKNYSGNEYLRIYPYIEEDLDDKNHPAELYVRMRKDNRITTVSTLKDWLFL